jgi:hypothetical protein
MARRITVTLDEPLEQALSQAAARLRLSETASESERLRALARKGYEALLDEERLATYRQWADDPELVDFADGAVRVAAADRLFSDE